MWKMSFIYYLLTDNNLHLNKSQFVKILPSLLLCWFHHNVFLLSLYGNCSTTIITKNQWAWIRVNFLIQFIIFAEFCHQICTSWQVKRLVPPFHLFMFIFTKEIIYQHCFNVGRSHFYKKSWNTYSYLIINNSLYFSCFFLFQSILIN